MPDAVLPNPPDGYPGWAEYAIEHASLVMAAVRLAMDTQTVVPDDGAALLRSTALEELRLLRTSKKDPT